MIDNTQDMGYICIELKKQNDSFYLCERSMFGNNPDTFSYYIDYKDGCIFIDLGENTPKKIIGYYESTADQYGLVKVYDSSKERVIGRVGNELIYFVKDDIPYSLGECLAYYTSSGNITAKDNLLQYYGIICGSEKGGAAAFVAVFNSYIFKCIFRDFFEMDTVSFKKTYGIY